MDHRVSDWKEPYPPMDVGFRDPGLVNGQTKGAFFLTPQKILRCSLLYRESHHSDYSQDVVRRQVSIP